MFNNWINRHDILSFKDKATSYNLAKICKAFGHTTKAGMVKSAWTSAPKNYTTWTDIPEIASRMASVKNGPYREDYYEYVAKFLKPIFPLTGVSLGCGMGDRELAWYRQCEWSSLTGYDLSESRIASAQARANQLGYDRLTFQVRDVNREPLQENAFDVVFGEDSIHHFEGIDTLFSSIARSLKPEGFFVINDFVGPSKFQWTDRQLELINGLLAVLPPHYRRCLSSNGRIKKAVHRPSLLHMRLSDPSEAVESSHIRKALHRHFDIVEMHEKGGTLLMLLLHDIAHNFVPEDRTACELVKALILLEDLLIESGDIESNFIFALCKAKR